MQGQFFQQPPRPDLKHNFANVPQAEIERSTFDRSHRHMTSFDAGFLVPFYIDEVMPGDTFDISATILARLNTPKKPLFDDATLSTFYVYCPYRILQDNFVKMMGQQDAPSDSIDFAEPIITVDDVSFVQVGTLWDYFGFPLQGDIVGSFPNPSVYPFRAYNMSWNWLFRDENLVDPALVSKLDTSDILSAYPLRRRGKRHDYYTSCLPFPQKGPDVLVPLGDTAPIVWQSQSWEAYSLVDASVGLLGTGDPDATTGGWAIGTDSSITDANPIGLRPVPTAPLLPYVDLSAATAANVNQTRLAFQTQRLLERSARGGTRFPELIHAQFGVTVPDYRVQQPEYLGGGKSPLLINPVPQTSPTSGTDPLAQLAGVGAFVTGGGHGFTHSFVEHGVVIGLMCVDANLSYTQGLERIWRGGRTRYDFYTPAFAHLGEQAVLSREIYCDGTANDDLVFGYQEAWAEYRYKPSRLTGLMRPTAPSSLAVWNLSQEFGVRPALSESFIQSDPPFDRVVQFPDQPHFIADIAIHARCTRPMPTFSVPGLIDHF